MLSHVELDTALALLAGVPVETAAERVPLARSLGRVLAEDCFASLSVPPFDKSPFDGYAYRTADVPGTLRVIGTAAAGCHELPEPEPGEALRIFTGAPVPHSADAVARQEDVKTGDGSVTIPGGAAPGTNIVRRGEDLCEGDRFLDAGTRLEPGHLGLLASQGFAEIAVFHKPRAVLIPTGSELAEPGESCGPFDIYNSSSYALTAYLTRMGFTVNRRPIVPDEPEALLSAVDAALAEECALVLTTGGASVGDYDFAAATAQALGAEPLFWKLNIKPGGAMLVSRCRGKLLVSLSGNPAAALMSLLTVLRPTLQRMTGLRGGEEICTLPVWDDMPKTCGATRMLRGHLLLEEGRAWFCEHQGRGNGNIASFVGCELIGLVPGGSGPLKRGDTIRVMRLPAYLL